MIIINPIYVSGITNTKKVEVNTDKTNKKGVKKFQLNTVKSQANSSINEKKIVADSLFYMIEGFKEHNEKRGKKYGEKILELLSKYRLKVISGEASLKNLYEIKELISVFRLNRIDDEVKNVVEEIELLANVELAKRGII